jgi:hypothetical protein
VEGEWTALTTPTSVDVVPLNLGTLPPADPQSVLAFRMETRDLRRAVLGASELLGEVDNRLNHLREALIATSDADPALMVELEALKARYDTINLAMNGDRTKGSRNVFTPPSIVNRVQRIAYDQWDTTQAPTNTHRQAYVWAKDAFEVEYANIQQLVTDLELLEAKAEAAGAPWTPGRVPSWP